MHGATMSSIGPEQPLLFFLEGLDMRWRSLATVAEQVEEGRRALAALALPADAVVAYTWRAGPDAVAADLAIRAGGWTALPLTAEEGDRSEGDRAEPPPVTARLLLPSEPEPVAAGSPPCARLPMAATELSSRRDRGELEVPLPSVGELTGGALIRSIRSIRPIGPGAPPGTTDRSGWRRLSPEEIAEAVTRIEETITMTGPGFGSGSGAGAGSGAGLGVGRRSRQRRGHRRPVVVACLDPSTASGRITLDWALASRAALCLEPDAWALGGIAGWCRPTVVAGDALGMASVAAEIRRRAGRRSFISGVGRRLLGVVRGVLRRGGAPPPPAPPLGRLRTALLLGDGAPERGAMGGRGGGSPVRLSADDLALFAGHGVELVSPHL